MNFKIWPFSITFAVFLKQQQGRLFFPAYKKKRLIQNFKCIPAFALWSNAMLGF